jgi:hypothetical protein
LVDIGCDDFAFHEIFSQFLISADLTSLNKLGVILSFLAFRLSRSTTIFQATDQADLMRFNKETLRMFALASDVKVLKLTIDTMYTVYDKIRDHTRASQMAMGMRTDNIIRYVLQFDDTFSEFAKRLKEFILRP